MENTDNIKRSVISFDDSKDIYVLRLLPARKNMQAFAKFTSLLLPILSVGAEEFNKYQKGSQEFLNMLQDEEADFVEEPSFSSYQLSLLVAEQLKEPEFLEVLDILLDGLYVGYESGGVVKEAPDKIDFDAHFFGEDFDKYLRIAEHAIKVNFTAPFGKWLENKGLSGICSGLQSAISAVLVSTGPK